MSRKVDFRCTRCGMSAIEAQTENCKESPCPMEPVEEYTYDSDRVEWASGDISGWIKWGLRIALIGALIIISFMMCGCENPEKTYEIEVIYENGDMDTLIIEGHKRDHFWINNESCLRQKETGHGLANWNRLACGVRLFRELDPPTLREEMQETIEILEELSD